MTGPKRQRTPGVVWKRAGRPPAVNGDPAGTFRDAAGRLRRVKGGRFVKERRG